MALTREPGPEDGALTTRGDDALVEAIVVPNSLWRADDPGAYAGGHSGLEITRLAEFQADGPAYL